ncbi:MAG: hypothetical protein KAR47_11650 [Planctomycetes bacterium]|nr:hypothetical protein [Planctomycetota bacterium]
MGKELTIKYKLLILMAGCLILAIAHAGLNTPAVVNSSFEDPALEAGAAVLGITDWFDSVS